MSSEAPKRAVSFVDDDERLRMLRADIADVAHTIESFRVAFEDGIAIDAEEAQKVLADALNRLQVAHINSYPSFDEDAHESWVLATNEQSIKTLLVNDGVQDTGIN